MSFVKLNECAPRKENPLTVSDFLGRITKKFVTRRNRGECPVRIIYLNSSDTPPLNIKRYVRVGYSENESRRVPRPTNAEHR